MGLEVLGWETSGATLAEKCCANKAMAKLLKH
jgi:hypothetical protein